MQIVNLTPHTLNVVGLDPIPPSREIARVATTFKQIGTLGSVPIFKTVTGQVTGLPETLDPDTIYVVSGQVKARFPDVSNVMSPGRLVRDDQGRVIGCEGLIAVVD